MTVAARQMVEKNVWVQRSYRIVIRRQSYIHPNRISIVCRCWSRGLLSRRFFLRKERLFLFSASAFVVGGRAGLIRPPCCV